MTEGSIELRVRYAETDQMGVVYHANYLVWCEVGRTELMRQVGLPYADVERSGVRLAVAEASLRFHSPARYDDPIRVRTVVEEVRTRSVSFAYTVERIANVAGERLVSARTTLVATDEDGSSRSLPPPLLQRLRDAR